MVCKLDLVMYQDSAHIPVFSRHSGDVIVRKDNLPDTYPHLKNQCSKPQTESGLVLIPVISWCFGRCRRPGGKPP